jgi:hypothetical protein
LFPQLVKCCAIAREDEQESSIACPKLMALNIHTLQAIDREGIPVPN